MNKRFFLLLPLYLIAFSQISIAQEVRGVETKVVCVYDCPDNDSNTPWSRDESVHWELSDEFEDKHYTAIYDKSRNGNYYYYHIYPGVAFEFSNLNSIDISVDAELYEKGILIETKSFLLKSKESYIWKHGKKGIDVRMIETYYVKYKAYKML